MSNNRMKNFILALCLIFGFGFATAAEAEVIKSFDVVAELKANRELTITENIRYDFGTTERHGIFRLLPDRYERMGAAYRLRLQVLEAEQDGQPVKMEVSRWGSEVNIRLGDEDETLTGEHTYTIRYRTNRAINDFPNEDERELYWNITGNGWNVPVESASWRLDGPVAATKTVCYVGPLGSTLQDCKISTKGKTVAVSASRQLYPGDGLTVAIRFPEQSIVALTLWDQVRNFLSDNIWAGLPLLTFIIMYSIWRVKGRDPKGRGSVIARYEEPRALKPAQMVALQNEHVSPRAITATLLDLARRGYLKLRWEGDPAGSGWFKAKPKFTLVKIKDADAQLLPFEAELFNKLFEDTEEVDAKEPNAGFSTAIQKSRDLIFDHLKKSKLYANSPVKTRALWIMAATLLAVFSPFLLVFYGVLALVFGLLSASVVAFFGWFMPRVSYEGAIVREEVEGFKLFLSVTEKDRLNFHNAPSKRPEQFERFLPAAIAFGVEKQWAEHFKDIQMQPPAYMEGSSSAWSSLAFVHAVGSLHTQSANSMYQSPSSAGSGGSGFSGGGSGGGFGGGGGGSW